MNKLYILVIVGSGVLAWWLPSYFDRLIAQRVFQITMVGLKPPPALPPGPRMIDDVPPNRVQRIPDVFGNEGELELVDPDAKSAMERVVIYMKMNNAFKRWWWLVPVGLTLLFMKFRPRVDSPVRLESVGDVPSATPPA